VSKGDPKVCVCVCVCMCVVRERYSQDPAWTGKTRPVVAQMRDVNRMAFYIDDSSSTSIIQFISPVGPRVVVCPR
jgi:hypothetical protein